jgi:hypothetical protein
MKGFKNSSFGRNVIEGLANCILLFPIFAIWIAAKRAGKYASGFVFATALYTFIPLGLIGLLDPVSKVLDPLRNNILGGLLVGGWLFALAYAIWGNPDTNDSHN